MVSKKGYAVAGFHRNETKPLNMAAKLPNGDFRKISIKPLIRKYAEQRTWAWYSGQIVDCYNDVVFDYRSQRTEK